MIESPFVRPGHHWPVTVEYGPLKLRPLRRRDGRAWTEVRRRNERWLAQWEPTAPPASSGEILTFAGLVATLNAQARDDRALPWGMFHAPGRGRGEFIGQITMSGIVLGAARAGQLGYWIDERWAGRGIVPAAVALACDHAFGAMRLHRVEIAIRPENTASLRVVEKLGFREEGLRPDYLHIDGAWRDHRVFALHDDEVGPGLLARVPEPRW